MITDNLEVSKKKVDFLVDNLGSGNIVPNHWYHELLRPCGKSDTTAIAILSELVFLYRYNNQSEFQLNYHYFKNKFNFGINQVKDAVVRLEQRGLLKRDFRTVIVLGRRFANDLYLVLNISNVLELNKQVTAKKFVKCDRNDHSGSVEITADNIETKYLNKKSRSNESNFNQSDFKENYSKSTQFDSSVTPIAGLSTPSSPVQLNLILPNPSQSLTAFHPLSKDDVEWLRIRSGRDFDMNFINQLLIRVGEKYPEKRFYSKPAVLSYMSKVLYGEMRDAVKVSNGCFKFADSNKQETSAIQTSTIKASSPEIDLDSAPNSISDLVSTEVSPLALSQKVLLKDDSVWSRVRQGLISYFSNGSGLDVSWFSKLTPTYDDDKRSLSLIAPSDVMRDWIKSNYESVIEQLCAKEDYQLNGVFV